MLDFINMVWNFIMKLFTLPEEEKEEIRPIRQSIKDLVEFGKQVNAYRTGFKETFKAEELIVYLQMGSRVDDFLNQATAAAFDGDDKRVDYYLEEAREAHGEFVQRFPKAVTHG